MNFLNNILLSTVFLITFLFSGFSQNAFEGKVILGMNYDQLPEGLEMMSAMLPDESVLYIKDDYTRAEQSIGMLGTQIVITDTKEEKVTMLYDMLGQKYAVIMSVDDLAEKEKPGKQKIEYINESKKVAGYNCKKAEISYDDDDGILTVWYTEDIPAASSNKFEGLNGFPLEYEVSKQEMKITITAKEISKEKVPSSYFQVPDGYKTITQEEMQQMFGGR
ncbi:MAG: hypothetical protein COA57_07635 [Flavobacteriales bacterium]|nr:MAG: hypothetical protein COA57_07635 [Flavobacteriales bacterium]